MVSTGRLLREHVAHQRVTNAELLFDLVFVFAVTQLSHHLIGKPTVAGAVQTLILLGLVWEAWAYTMWATNWLDPDRVLVRLMLFTTALGSLVLSVGLPEAFTTRGWAVAGAYAGIQIGRTIFVILSLGSQPTLQRNFERILCWCVASGALALVGAAVDGSAREVLWAAAVCLDVLGGLVTFYVPGMGRASTTDWTIEGGHLAERCHAFVLIALGESVVVLGTTLSDLARIDTADVLVFVFGFVGVVGLWWIYFDRAADMGAEMIASAADPGRLGRAYHEIHPIMVGGIIAVAAADDLVLVHPYRASGAITWTVLGGSMLFIGGHALFKAVLWHARPWSRIVAVLILVALLPVAPHIAPIALAACALAVTLLVCVSDALFAPPASASMDV